MPRLSRKLRVCKWIGTVGCAVIAAAFLFSGWWYLEFKWTSKLYQARVKTTYDEGGEPFDVHLPARRYTRMIGLIDGAIGFAQGPEGMGVGWRLASCPAPVSLLSKLTELPKVWENESHGASGAFVPLWLPFLVLLIPALLLWRRDLRKQPRPGFCPRCDYDLTGNTSGVCPECGAACELALKSQNPEG